MEIIEKKITELKPYHNNPRNNKEAIKLVANSIKEFGFKVPIVIDSDGVIVAGHTRYEASKKLKLKKVPCIVADDLTEKQIQAYRLADNKVAEVSEWDLDLLAKELLDLDEIDMGEFGFDLEISNELEDEPKPELVDDEVPAIPEEPISKKGDIYKLGNHRLICGDSTNAEDVARLMDGKVADLVFTDPPYGMKKEKDGVTNDNLNYNDLLEFNKKWIPLSFKHTKENGSWYCWGIDEPLMDIYSQILKPMVAKTEITFRNLITWDKRQSQGMGSDKFGKYASGDEKCLFVMRGFQGIDNNVDNYYEAWEPIRSYLESEWRKYSKSNDWEKFLGNKNGRHYFTKSQFRLPTEKNYKRLQETGYFKKPYEEIKKEYETSRSYFDNAHDNMYNVWYFPITNQAERELAGGHATPKPLALCARAIKSSSREGELVLDLFGGSGSTLIACEQLGRSCYMVEFEPKYVDVIIKRWETITGKKAEKVGEIDG